MYAPLLQADRTGNRESTGQATLSVERNEGAGERLALVSGHLAAVVKTVLDHAHAGAA